VVPLRIWFLVAACSLCCGAAEAAPAKPATAGTFGSRDQLRDCLELDDAVKASAQALQVATLANNARIGAGDAEVAQLAVLKKTLDRNDKAAIAAYNQLAQAHNVHSDETDLDVAKAEALAGALAADKAAMAQKCGTLTWRPADVDMVNRERRKASAAAVTAAASAP
jgi:hypothetical protein